jgi:proteic killer suppression protein
VIRSFKCKDTERLFNDESVDRFRGIEDKARRKLEILNAVINLNDLRSPPGNRLEALKGDRKGQHSIASVLTINGASVLFGTRAMLMMWKSLIITN